MSVVSIESYLLMHDEPFSIHEYQGRLGGTFYIQGWIDMRIDNQVVLGRQHVDFIDQLWVYIANGATEIKNGKSLWEGYFPDQPLRLAMESKSRKEMEFCVGKRSFGVKKAAFVQAVGAAAKSFFERMHTLAPEDAASWSLFIKQADELLQ